jgi:hypothetical protein
MGITLTSKCMYYESPSSLVYGVHQAMFLLQTSATGPSHISRARWPGCPNRFPTLTNLINPGSTLSSLVWNKYHARILRPKYPEIAKAVLSFMETGLGIPSCSVCRAITTFSSWCTLLHGPTSTSESLMKPLANFSASGEIRAQFMVSL